MSTALPARRLNPPGTKLTRAQVQIVKNTIAKDATHDELAFFIAVCERTGLNPLARQIHYVKVWDSQIGAKVGQPIVGIDGLRLIAERTGEYAGQDAPEWYDAETGTWSDVWIGKRPPDAARVLVYRHGIERPFVGIALWTEYAQTNRAGEYVANWKPDGGKPAHMLAKCAEALGLRKGFPNELAGLYTEEELGKSIPTTPDNAAAIDEREDRKLLRCVFEVAEENGLRGWTAQAVLAAAQQQWPDAGLQATDDLTDEHVESILGAVPPRLMELSEERLRQQNAGAMDGHATVVENDAPAALEPASSEPGLAEQVAAAQETREPVEAKPAAQEPPPEPAAAQEPAQAPTQGFLPVEEIPFGDEPAGPGTYAGEPGQS